MHVLALVAVRVHVLALVAVAVLVHALALALVAVAVWVHALAQQRSGDAGLLLLPWKRWIQARAALQTCAARRRRARAL